MDAGGKVLHLHQMLPLGDVTMLPDIRKAAQDFIQNLDDATAPILEIRTSKYRGMKGLTWMEATDKLEELYQKWLTVRSAVAGLEAMTALASDYVVPDTLRHVNDAL